MLRRTAFLDMFARSPIRPLQKHMEKAHACVECLWPFYEAIQAGDWPKSTQLKDEINRLEHDADDLKKDMRLHLPKGLFLPVPRTDLLRILSKQERLVNKAKDIAGIMLGRKMQYPLVMREDFGHFLRRSISASAQAKRIINVLDELLEAGFRGKGVSIVDEMMSSLNDIEYETDTMQVALRQQLFDFESDLPPVDVMFLYQVIEAVGNVADCAENVGACLEMLLAKS